MLDERNSPVEKETKKVVRTRDGFDSFYISLWHIGVNSRPVKSKILYNTWRFFAIGIGIIYIPFSYLINYAVNFDKFTFSEFLFSVQICLNCFCLLSKFAVLYAYFTVVDGALEELDEMEKYCETEEEFQKIEKIVALCKKTSTFYLFYYSSYGVTTCLVSIYASQPPYNTYYPFLDWRESTTQLHIQQFIEFLTVGYPIYCAGSTDAGPLILVLALTGHVDILTNRVAKLGIGKDKLSESERYKKLSECIETHKAMLRYCEKITNLMSPSIFSQFLFCGTIIGVTLINLMVSRDTASRCAIIVYISAVLLQTFPLCYCCTSLTEGCFKLADTVFHSQWMFENQSYRKTILQFLQKCQQPMTFNALNIFDINLATNISVAKFAFSVYAIAKTMRLDEKFKSYGELMD